MPEREKRFFKKSDKKTIRANLLRFFVLCLLALTFYLLQLLLLANPQWGNFYAENIFPLLRAVPLFISRLLPVSFMFVSFVIILPSAFFFLLYSFVMILRRRDNRRRQVLRLLSQLSTIVVVLYVLYMLLHGFNYARSPLSQKLALNPQPRSASELHELTVWLAKQTNMEKEGLAQTAEGLLLLEQGRQSYLQVAAKNAPAVYDSVVIRPKAVPLSQYWSYTNITGMYFPYFAEANVNADTMPDEFLFSALHEIAHVQGYAREDEANFLAFYSGKDHEWQEFRYAAYLTAFIHAYNRLHGVAAEMADEVWAMLKPEVQADIQARNRYWAQFQGPVERVSTNINDSFLKANHQELGVQSYGMVVDLLLAYYFESVVA